MNVSVLIATKDRNDLILSCIRSILLNSYPVFEILVIDQANTSYLSTSLHKLNTKNIRYFKTSIVGKSQALNIGLAEAKGDIVAFTDDDCIVSIDWLKAISDFYKTHPNIDGSFGRTLPHDPKKHLNHICPATYKSRSRKILQNKSNPLYTAFGMGNNMSFRKGLTDSVGQFKTWLGVGSVSKNGGEEYEYMYRAVQQGFRLQYNPSMVVFHNRWLKYQEEQVLQSHYTSGLVAYQIYHLIRSRDLRFLHHIGHRLQRMIYSKICLIVKQIIEHPFQPRKWHKKELLYAGMQTVSLCRGIFLGTTHALIEQS